MSQAQNIASKVASDILFLAVPGLSFMVTLSWRDFILEYYNDKFKHMDKGEQLFVKKLMLAFGVTIITLILLFFVRR